MLDQPEENVDTRQQQQQARKVPCIIIMDSLLAGSPRYQTVGVLRDYLAQEFVAKRPNAERVVFDRTTCRGVYPKVSTVLEHIYFNFAHVKMHHTVESVFARRAKDSNR